MLIQSGALIQRLRCTEERRELAWRKASPPAYFKGRNGVALCVG